jgi:predicted enzyme related to lactoylglutathione lyase
METKQAQRPAAPQAGKTKNLSKLSAESNAITWFEIPVSDMKRAKKFYETVLDIQLTTAKAEGDMEAMELFPRLPDVSMGRTDVVSGSLIKADRLHPAGDGILVYLNANPELDKIIGRITPAGGKIVLPKTKNPAGYVCIFEDTEGNKMGLYAGN